MDIVLSNFIDYVPKNSVSYFENLIDKMEETCMSPKDIYKVIKIITTNNYIYEYLEYPNSTSIQTLETNIFKEVRSNLDKHFFIKIGPLIHVLINQFLKSIKPNSYIHTMLRKRHQLISNLALEYKEKNDHLSDFDAWIKAENELFSI